MKTPTTKQIGRVFMNAYRRISEETKECSRMSESAFLLLFTRFCLEEWEKIRGRRRNV